MLRTARAPVGVLVLGGIALLVPPQMSDMLAFLESRPVLGGLSFQGALFLLGLSAWFWSRAALAARFGVEDGDRRHGVQGGFGWTAFTWIPRVVLGATFALGVGIALTGRSPVSAILALVLGLIALAFTIYRPRATGRPAVAAPPSGTVTLWKGARDRFRSLIACSPYPGLALVSLCAGLLPLLLGFIEAFTYALRVPNVLATAFPGPSVVLLLLALMIAPLTCLTFVCDAVSLQRRVAGLEIGPRRPPVLLLLFAIVFVAAPWFVPSMHAVRTVPAAPSRSRLDELFGQWVEACAKDQDVIRPVIVDMSGGATRAGLWGAAVLDQVLRAQRPGGPALFAVSSVSGGSLGAAAAMTLLQAEPIPCKANGLAALRPRPDGSVPLSGDALGPLLGGWLVDDIPRSGPALAAGFLRYVGLLSRDNGGGDSARAIEEAFGDLWTDVRRTGGASVKGTLTWEKPFLDLFYVDGKYRAGMPIWVANGTDAKTGDRVITAPICTSSPGDVCSGSGARPGPDANAPWPFGGARDFRALTGADVTIETAINNTARFPYLEPFGYMLRADRHAVGSLIDGGYFENEGIQSALDLAAWMQNHHPDGRTVEPVIVQATADGEPDVDWTQLMRCGHPSDSPDKPSEGSALPQLLAPLSGLYHVRGGHSAVLLRRAVDTMCPAGKPRFFNFYLPGQDGKSIPLNWVLSTGAARFIWCGAWSDAGHSQVVQNDVELGRLRTAMSAGTNGANPPPSGDPWCAH